MAWSRLKTRKPLKAKTPLERKTPLAQKSVKRKAAEAAGEVKAKRLQPAVPTDIKAALKKRAGEGEWCEMQLSGCAGRGVDPSHRISTKNGGRHGAARERHNRLSNVLWACRVCHTWCHGAPNDAKDMGLFLSEGAVPTQEPVLYRGVPAYLDDAGGVHEFEAVGA